MTKMFLYLLIILSFIGLLFWSIPKKGKSNRKLETMSFENGIPVIHLGKKYFLRQAPFLVDTTTI